jgi:hypothetical protein
MRFIRETLLAALALALPAAPAPAAPAGAMLRLGTAATTSDAAARAKGWIEVESWSWGTSNNRKGWDGTIKGRRDAVRSPGRIEVPLDSSKFGAVAGAQRDEGVDPLPSSGTLRIKVKFPWLDCRVGATFPDAELRAQANRYAFAGLVVTGCPGGAAGSASPADPLVLTYAKVTVRGWDPEK